MLCMSVNLRTEVKKCCRNLRHNVSLISSMGPADLHIVLETETLEYQPLSTLGHLHGLYSRSSLLAAMTAALAPPCTGSEIDNNRRKTMQTMQQTNNH